MEEKSSIPEEPLINNTNQKKQLQQRNGYIQFLRALAIIAVVAIHNCPEGRDGVYIRPFVNFSVALFLFLSGYLTKEEKMQDLATFYKKRIFRVMIPYVIWSVIYAVVRGYSWETFVEKFFTAQCCGVFYYLIVYVQLVLITPLLYRISHTKYKNYVYLITPIAIIFVYLYVLNDNSLEYPYYVISLVEWISYYYFGLAFHFRGKPLKCMQLIETGKKHKWILIVVYLAALTLQYIESFLWYDNGELAMAKTQVKLSTMITSFATILLVMYYKNSIYIPQTNIFVMIGDYSFGIYLTHMLFLDLLNDYTHFNYISGIIMVFLLEIIIISFLKWILPEKVMVLLGLE